MSLQNMAADTIRVRLHFDYAPPAAVGCRMCWLLVDRGSCRVVADLESIIREKFELSHGSILSLFIEDCYLPHTESVLLVRDNDCVRVKVETVSNHTTQNSPGTVTTNSRKRHAEYDEESGPALEFKKKKRKKSMTETPTLNHVHTVKENTQASPKKKGKSKKKAEEKPKAPPTAPEKPSPNAHKLVKATKKPSSSSSSTSSSSEDEEPVKNKAPPPKPAPKPALVTKNIPKKLPLPTSSSSSDLSSEEDATKVKPKPQNKENSDAVQASNGAKGSEEEEIELVIKKPVQHPHGRIILGEAMQEKGQPGTGRGGGRGRQQEARETWRKGRGRGVRYDYSPARWEGPSYSTDKLTNVSTVLQNGVTESEPKPDYSSLPLLAAPPQVGQKIAFKLLELTENYTPEVSDYKEAKIINFDPTSKQIELELLTCFQAPVEPGKFDLVYQNPDGSERVEYAVDRGSLVTERWDSLLEPRLVI